jgi:hypothetical protein
MADGEDYVMRPVGEGLCKYESLIDGTVDLADVARMNDWLDVRDENQERHRKANEKNA